VGQKVNGEVQNIIGERQNIIGEGQNIKVIAEINVSLLPTPSCNLNVAGLLLSHAKKSEVYERTDVCLDRIMATKRDIPKQVL